MRYSRRMPTQPEQAWELLDRKGIASVVHDTILAVSGTPLGGLVVNGDDALEAWDLLRSASGLLGRWPVLLGTEEELEAHRRRIAAAPQTVAEILAASATEPDLIDVLLPPAPALPDDVAPSEEFSTPFDPESGEPLEEVFLALVPTVRPWEVAAHLKLSGPHPPAVHVAAWKRWYDRHRATVVAVTPETVEMLADRPPSTPESAWVLAHEQLRYCGAASGEGDLDPAELAATLLGGTAWYLWLGAADSPL